MTVTVKLILDHWGFHEEWRHGFPQSLYDNPTPLGLFVKLHDRTGQSLTPSPSATAPHFYLVMTLSIVDETSANYPTKFPE